MEEEKHGLGCLPGKYDIRDYKLKKGLAMAVEYPQEFCCEKKVAIKNQGCVGSCVAHATAEILEYHEDVLMATDFVYGIHKKLYNSEGPGMFLREALQIVHDYGNPAKSFCSTNTEVSKVYDIANTLFENEEAMENALHHRADSYARLITQNDIKYALMNYGPVLAAIMWYSENKCTDGVLQKSGTMDGGHAIMILGWNEQGWVCQNSWGKYWGDNGYFILPYGYGLLESYSFVPDGNKDDIVMPTKNEFMTIIFKCINAIVNIVAKIVEFIQEKL